MRIAIFVAVVAAHIALVWYFLTLWQTAMPAEEEDQSSMTLVFLTLPEPAPKPAAGAPVMRRGSPAATAEPQGQTPSSPQTGLAESAQQAHQANLAASPDLTEPPRLVDLATSPDLTEPPRLVDLATSPDLTEPPKLTGLAASPDLTEPPEQTDLTEAPGQVDLTAPRLLQPTPQAAQPVGPNWYDQAHAVAEVDAQHIVESEDRAARQAGALTAMIKPLPGPHVPGPSFPWDPAPRYRWRRAPGGGWVMAVNDHCDIGFFIMIFVGCSIGELPPARGDLFKNMHPPVKYGDWDWRLDDP